MTDTLYASLLQLYALFKAHAWVALAAILVGLVTRLLKDDTKIPLSLPSRVRAPAALVLGILSGVLDKVAGGDTWADALLGGLAAALAAIAGHNLIVDSLRNGREFTLPFLMRPGVAPSPGKLPTVSIHPPPPKTIVPPPTTMLLVALGASVLMHEAACAKLATVLDLASEKARCVVANQDLPDALIIEKCAIQPGDFAKYEQLLADSRAATKKALERQAAELHASSTRVDAGAPTDASADGAK